MTKKFIQMLDPRIMRHLKSDAKKKGVTIQTLLRSEIIPFWLRKEQLLKAAKEQAPNGNTRKVPRR